MDLVRSLAQLEEEPELHLGRVLVLLCSFAGANGTGHVEGLTKLAKLDFLLRYPTMLERALKAKHRSTTSVGLEPHERTSVESRMVRYRFGPWDHRYRMLLNILVARGLATVSLTGKTVSLGLTPDGFRVAQELSASHAYASVARRARLLHAHFDVGATHLMRFIYDTFPEVLTLRMNESITP